MGFKDGWLREDGAFPNVHRPQAVISLSLTASNSQHTKYIYLSEVRSGPVGTYRVRWMWDTIFPPESLLRDIDTTARLWIAGAIEEEYGGQQVFPT